MVRIEGKEKLGAKMCSYFWFSDDEKKTDAVLLGGVKISVAKTSV